MLNFTSLKIVTVYLIKNYMEQIKAGKYVELVYDLFEVGADGDQELMLSMTKDRPECIVFGVEENVLPALVNALEGKAVGDTFDLTLSPKDAFGEVDERAIMDLDKEIFCNDEGVFDSERVKAGFPVNMMTAEGYPVTGLILSIGEKVKVDFNHPLAGKTVRFNGSVQTVREATEEDKHPSCGGCGDHGCGSCGGGCGDCGGGCEGGGCCE